jgi:hypothetical protein
MGSALECRAIVALWIDSVLLVMLLRITSCPFRSGGLQTLTCTLNC